MKRKDPERNIPAAWSEFLQRTTVHGLPLWYHAKGKVTEKTLFQRYIKSFWID